MEEVIKIQNKTQTTLKRGKEEWVCLRCRYTIIKHFMIVSNRRKCPECGYMMNRLPVRNKPPSYIM